MASTEDQRRRTRRLVLCLVVAVVVRLVALQVFSGIERFHGDEGVYQKTAASILAGEGHPGSLRAPLYPAFIAGVYAVVGKSPLALRLVQILLSLLAVLVVFRIVSARFGTQAATISGLACALLPTLAHYTHFLWSECLGTTLLMLFFWALEGYDRTGRAGMLALAGVALGFTTLARETWALFAVLVVCAMVWRHRSTWREALVPAAVFLGCLALVVLPWTVRNYVVDDSVALVSTGHWYPMAKGNLLSEDDWLLGAVRTNEGRAALRGASDREREAYWRSVALESIRAEQPWWILKKTIRNTSLLFSVESQAVRYVWRGWVELRPWEAYTVLATSVVGHLLAVALGISALWLVRGGWLRHVVVAAILYTIGVHVIANATSRYLVPLMPLFVLYVGPLLARRQLALSRLRLVGAALTLLAFAILVGIRWSHDLGPALEAANALSPGP